MIGNIEEQANLLVEIITLQVQEERLRIAQEMVDRGYTPEDYHLEDNLLDVIEDPKTPYSIKAVMRIK